MKYFTYTLLIVLLMGNIVYGDQILKVKPENINVRETKSGGKMGTFEVIEHRTLSGVKYTVPVQVVTFSESTANELMQLDSTKTYRFIVSNGMYKGNKQYILRKIIK